MTREYTELVRNFASEGVPFVMGSDNHWTGTGSLYWARHVLQDAQVPSSQYIDPHSYLPV